MDLNQIMALMNNPQVRQLLQSLMAQMSQGQGGNANLGGLLDQLSAAGLGDHVQSWVGTGENQPLTGRQLQQALGGGMLDQAAAQAGTSPEQAADDLASVLPQLVDQASPQGQLPDAQSLQSMLGGLLGGGNPPR